MKTEFFEIVTAAIRESQQISDMAGLTRWKKEFLGENSQIIKWRNKIKEVPKSDRAELGKNINAAKEQIEIIYQQKLQSILVAEEEQKFIQETLDLTLPISRIKTGAIHPIFKLIEQTTLILENMGWKLATGPEIESEAFNFDALNFLADHPSRSLQDTILVDPPTAGLLLRTHTSPVQVRAMLTQKPPLFLFSPGRVFRADTLDATHTPVFHQLEGIAVAKALSMADLIGTLTHLAQELFNDPNIKIRLRPHYFPFTKPSAEVDIWFPAKKGGAGWVEWCGCGMVHPNVLLSSGIDPNLYTGFAFGVGLERTLQFQYAITHMKEIVEGDVRFSLLFGV